MVAILVLFFFGLPPLIENVISRTKLFLRLYGEVTAAIAEKKKIGKGDKGVKGDSRVGCLMLDFYNIDCAFTCTSSFSVYFVQNVCVCVCVGGGGGSSVGREGEIRLVVVSFPAPAVRSLLVGSVSV